MISIIIPQPDLRYKFCFLVLTLNDMDLENKEYKSYELRLGYFYGAFGNFLSFRQDLTLQRK